MANLAAEYAPGSPKYNNLANAYSVAAADEAYRIALDGGERWEIAEAMARFNPNADQTQLYGNGSTSALSQFGYQITTNPLAAPFEDANKLIGNSVLAFLKNPWVLLTVAFIVWWKLGFPGAPALKKKFA
jgi:hypothetical protein